MEYVADIDEQQTLMNDGDESLERKRKLFVACFPCCVVCRSVADKGSVSDASPSGIYVSLTVLSDDYSWIQSSAIVLSRPPFSKVDLIS